MEGPENVNRFPLISPARVIGYDSTNHGVIVSLPSMQSISVSVKILFNGTSDATRIEQQPLPILGTWGLVAFPYGLVESATWLGSFYQSPVTAVNSSNPPTEQDGQMKYMSHASGSWSLLDYIGQYAFTLGDGTQILINNSNQPPPTYRRTVDTNGNVTIIPYYQSDRNPNPAAPFWVSINHPGSGASATISPSGDVTIIGGGPTGTTQAMVNLANDGTATIQGGEGVLASLVIQPNGIATLQTGGNPGAVGAGVQTGPSATFDPQTGLTTIEGTNTKSSITMDINGAVIATAANGNSQILMDKDGNISIISTNKMITIEAKQEITVKSDSAAINIEANGGDIFLNSSTHTDSLNTIINTFNAHVHSGVQTGSSNTAPPTTTLP